jgi:glycosyltransferase involved in cell wall biosynthesis
MLKRKFMKILQIYKTYTPDSFGGIEQVIKNIVAETTLLGAEHHLCTLSNCPRQDTIAGLGVSRFNKNFEIASCPFSVDFFSHIKEISQNYDLIHYHYPWPFADFTHLLRRINMPYLITFHADALKNNWLKQLYRPFQQRFLAKAQHIVATSAPLLASSPDLRAYQRKCSVIPLSIRAEDYPAAFPERLDHWRERVGEDFALFVGVLRHYKGLPILLAAAARTPMKIVIAGAGPLEAELKATVAAQGLKNVYFAGRVSEADKIALLTLSRLVVLPSTHRAEAFGISLLEGLLFKKPLISTELGTGTSFVNQHGRTGFVVPPFDAKALSEALTCFHSDATLAAKMGEAGYQWFLEQFQSAIIGHHYDALYRQLISR